MDRQNISLVAGIISSNVFAIGYLPMLIRAFRTKDLRSYSVSNLLLSNLGNMIHWLYIINLPFGPIWFLHTFYTLVTAMMLFWYMRYHGSQLPSPDRSLKSRFVGWCISLSYGAGGCAGLLATFCPYRKGKS